MASVSHRKIVKDIHRIMALKPLNNNIGHENLLSAKYDFVVVGLFGHDTGKVSAKSQEQLDRLHEGCVRYASAIGSVVDGYGPNTKDMTQFISLWNSFIDFYNSFPNEITFPNTPDNQRKVLEIRSSTARIINCRDRAIDIVLGNLERDVSAFELAVNALCASRAAFETTPSPTNNLAAIQRATAAAQDAHVQISPYRVWNNERARDLFLRHKAAFDRALPCAKIDEIDRLRQEYVEYKSNTVPPRTAFYQLGAPWNWGEYSVGFMSPSVQAAAQRIVANGRTSITSAYRK